MIKFKVNEVTRELQEFDLGEEFWVLTLKGTYYNEEFEDDLRWWLDVDVDSGHGFAMFVDGGQDKYDALREQWENGNLIKL